MPPVVISLSTLPPRSNFLALTLESLLCQSHRPDEILVNVPYAARRSPGDIEVPACLANLQRRAPHLQLVRTQDCGPGTKLLPALERVRDPQAIIITVDDDMTYDRHLVATLVKWSNRYPTWAVGFRGWDVAPDGSCMRARTHFVDVLQGFAGAAYRRAFFGGDVLEAYRRHPTCFFVDDVWISGYLAERGHARYLIRPGPSPTATPNTSINALKSEPEKVRYNRDCAMCWDFSGRRAGVSRGPSRLPRARVSYQVAKPR